VPLDTPLGGKVVVQSAPPGWAFVIREIEVYGTIRRITGVEQLPAGPTGPEGEENQMPQSSASGSSTLEACRCKNLKRLPDPYEKSRVSQPLRERLCKTVEAALRWSR
jgi:hypothetical protein